ncbi:MAG: hypothetical protein H6710_14845 [Myxococcales bacterium]|nr:hypothetical protein [Myxococcales bacterium]
MALPSLVRRLALGTTLAATALAGASPADAGESVNILVLRENGVGTAAQAQPYVDSLVAHVGRINKWAAASGKYVTTRTAAESYMHESFPHYGFMSLGAFLGLRGRHQLEVIGSIEVAQAGGREYHVVSVKQSGVDGCKGKSLATDHGSDTRFVDNVVAGGAFKLADFTLVSTRRPIQTLKSVINGEAECALIDDAQLAALSGVEGGGAVKSVWKSKTLPPMVAVAVPTAPADERKAFVGSLSKICAGEGAASCKEVGIASLKAASESDYREVITAYGK